MNKVVSSRDLFVSVVSFSLLLFSCQPSSDTSKIGGTVSTSVSQTQASSGTLVKPVPKNIGDVEQTVFINLKLADKSRSPRIQVDMKADAIERIRLLTLDIQPPFPDELWFDVECQCRESYDETPVIIRGQYTVNGVPTTETITIVLGERSNQTHPLPPLEVMHLIGKPIPETVLISSKLEGLLMPPGTNPLDINPLTADVEPDRKSQAILSTAIRINFHKEDIGKEVLPEPGPPLEIQDNVGTKNAS